MLFQQCDVLCKLHFDTYKWYDDCKLYISHLHALFLIAGLQHWPHFPGVCRDYVTHRRPLNRTHVLHFPMRIRCTCVYAQNIDSPREFCLCAIFQRPTTFRGISLVSCRKRRTDLPWRRPASRSRIFLFFSIASSSVSRSQGERLDDDEQPLPDHDDMPVLRLL